MGSCRAGQVILVVSTMLAVLVHPAPAHQPASLDETITFFYYRDLATAARFYEDVLQLQKTMDEDWVKIYRITPTSSVGLVLEGRGFHSVSADKPAMLSIVTGDVDAWYARLAESGAVFLSELPAQDNETGAEEGPVRGFVVEDPGGYTIEIFSWLEGD